MYASTARSRLSRKLNILTLALANYSNGSRPTFSSSIHMHLHTHLVYLYKVCVQVYVYCRLIPTQAFSLNPRVELVQPTQSRRLLHVINNEYSHEHNVGRPRADNRDAKVQCTQCLIVNSRMYI